jgi:hypothetical protein
MQRRGGGTSSSGGGTGGGPTPPVATPSFSATTSSTIAPPPPLPRNVIGTTGRSKIHSTTATTNASQSTTIGSILCSSPFLLFMAILLTAITYLKTPYDIVTLENEAIHAEEEVVHWLNGEPIPKEYNNDSSNQRSNSQPSQSIMTSSSNWVDGEKKLKIELKKLVELQKQGKELGVPVLTRWLGDDIPAWAGTGVDVDEWNSKVEAAYETMRREEEQWKEKIWKIMEEERKQ